MTLLVAAFLLLPTLTAATAAALPSDSAASVTERSARRTSVADAPLTLLVETRAGLVALTTSSSEAWFERSEGRIELRDASGGRAVAQVELGCLEVEAGASCSFVAPPAPSSVGSMPGAGAPREIDAERLRLLLRPRRPMASTQVNCPGGGDFNITTGTASGGCTILKDGFGNVTGGRCNDDNGTPGDTSDDSGAEASCLSNQGQGACGDSWGQGDCDTP